MTFPAAWVTSSQAIVLGLALRATGAAVLDKSLCCNCSGPPRAFRCVWIPFPGLWATSNSDILQAIPCSWAMACSRFSLDFICTVAESNAGNLTGTVDLNHRRCCVLIPVKSELLASRVKKYFEN